MDDSGQKSDFGCQKSENSEFGCSGDRKRWEKFIKKIKKNGKKG